VKARAAAIVALLTAVLLNAAPVRAASLLSYIVAAQAPGMQITYDNPTAPFHPLGEGEINYALSTLDATRGHALASVIWPGSAGGNVGSLLGVLGAPTLPGLNDPVKADVATGAGPDTQTISSPTGTEMTASVKSANPNEQNVSSATKAGELPLGAGGSVGSSSATSSVVFDQLANTMTAKATSTATNIGLGGVLSIGSVTSSATTVSVNGAAPKVSSTTVFHDMKIAGQEAYVDGSGVHVGVLGKPTNPPVVGLVNQALAASGMQIFFTAPYRFAIGGLTYDYAASILVYWAPPEPNHDVMTISLGGAAISMQITPGTDATPVSPTAPSGLPPSPGATSLSLPTPASPGAVTFPPSQLPHTSSPAPAAAANPTFAAPLDAASRGVGAPWLVLLAALAVGGAVVLPRLPGLVGAGTRCDRERPYLTSREP
jgi:hypothetical protein